MPLNNQPRVLIVEDDRINAFIVQKFLEGQFQSKLAINGTAALELVDSSDFDIVLMDINLGDGQLDGVGVMQKLREMEYYQNIPIIATTAYAMPGDKERFLEVGFDAYLPKPLKRNLLISTIEEKLNLTK